MVVGVVVGAELPLSQWVSGWDRSSRWRRKATVTSREPYEQLAMSLSLRRYSFNTSKENGEEKIVFARVDGRGGNLLAPHDSIPIMRSTIRF